MKEVFSMSKAFDLLSESLNDAILGSVKTLSQIHFIRQ